jgi:hypothetical protein
MYSVSAFRAVTSRKDAFGYSRDLLIAPIGARIPTGAPTFVTILRVISIVASGLPKVSTSLASQSLQDPGRGSENPSHVPRLRRGSGQ